MSKEKMYIRGNYNLFIPAHLHFGRFMLDRLKRMGDRIAILNPETGEKATYRTIAEYAVKVANSLSKLGVKKGDIVAFGFEKRLMVLPTLIGISLSGAIYTPFDICSGKAQLHHMLKITEPKFFITTQLFWDANQETLKRFDCVKTFITLDNPNEFLRSLDSLIAGCEDDVASFVPEEVKGQVDTAIILYSSGTTGMPKGVQITHMNAIIYSLPHDFEDKEAIKVAYIDADWYHDYDTFMSYKMLAHGIKIVYTVDKPLEVVLDVCIKEQVNIIFFVPSIINLFTKLERKPHEDQWTSLKYAYVAASPVHVKTLEKFLDRFPSVEQIIQGYGMTEIWVVTCESCSPKGPKLGSVGSVCPCITLKVEHPETRELLGPNQPGEICARGPQLMKGYLGMDPATYLDADGFLRTGDLGYYDKDGYFYIVDRIKEIIDVQGFKVAPLEVETTLQLHPGVKEAGVVGKKVPIFGEEPTAFVVRRSGSTVSEQDLIDFVAAELSPYMRLKGGVKFVAELPKNPRGKILRRRLREMLDEA